LQIIEVVFVISQN